MVLHVVGGPGCSGKAVRLRAESMQRSVVLGVGRNGRSGSKVILEIKDKVCLSSQKRTVVVSVRESNL